MTAILMPFILIRRLLKKRCGFRSKMFGRTATHQLVSNDVVGDAIVPPAVLVVCQLQIHNYDS